MVISSTASLKRARKETLDISTEEDAVKSLNALLKQLKCYSENKDKGSFHLLTIPQAINFILAKSSEDRTTFTRTALIDQLIFQNMFLFYTLILKFESDFENAVVERAKIWMGDCMMEMIGNTDKELHISSLDALLTSFGEYDSIEFNILKSKFMIKTLTNSSSSEPSTESLDGIWRLYQNVLDQNHVDEGTDQPFLSTQMTNFLQESKSLLHLL